MMVYKGEIWLCNLNPIKKDNEVGKIRPVVIFQTNELNNSKYPTIIILPLTTQLIDDAEPLRFRVNKKENLLKDLDLLVAQIRAIDKNRLIKKLATLTKKEIDKIESLFNEVIL